MPRFERFAGLDNKSDPTTLFDPETGIAFLRQCTNAEIDNSYHVRGPLGHTLWKAGNYISIYTSKDFTRLYAITADNRLVQIDREKQESTLLSNLAFGGTLWQWTEFERVIYATDGANWLKIHPVQGALPWGLAVPPPVTLGQAGGTLPPGRYKATVLYRDALGAESGAPEPATIDLEADRCITINGIVPQAGLDTLVAVSSTNGPDLFYAGVLPAGATGARWDGPLDALSEPMNRVGLTGPPGGDILGTWGAQVWLGQYMPEDDLSVIWKTQPQRPDLFDPEAEHVPLRGRVRMLAGTTEGMVIGTNVAVYLDQGTTKTALTHDFGVVPGRHAAYDRLGRLYFWTRRGVCTAPPLQLLSDARVSVPPGREANAGIVDLAGFERYVVSTRAGGPPARNPYV